jgi:hypothetical protein
MAKTKITGRRTTKESPRLKVVNPGKGLNIHVSDNLIDDREASDLQNVQFVEAGGVGKRYGYTAYGTGLANNPRGLGTLLDSSGSRYLCTVDGTQLKYIKDSGATWTAATGATFTSGKATVMVQARSQLIVWNGTDGGIYFDGSACTQPGTMPSAKFGLFYKSFHFAAGTGTQVNRLYISTVTDATDFTNAATTLNNSTEVPGATVFAGTGANFIDIDKDDGDKIQAITTFQDSVIVFKERSIHQVTLDSSGTPSVALVTRAMGAVSHKAVVQAENDVFFMSRRGVFVLGNEPQFFTAIRTNELSTRVTEKMRLISAANLSLSAGAYFDYKYYLGVPEGGTSVNNILWTYDRRYLAFARTKSGVFNAESFATYIDTNNNENLYFTSSNSAAVYKVSQAYNDNGSAIDAYWISKAYDAGDFDITKRWIYVDLLFRQVSGSIAITIYNDAGTLIGSASIPAPTSTGELGNQLLGNELLGGDPSVQTYSGTNSASINVPYRVPIRKNSRSIKVKIANANTNETFILNALIFGYIPYSQFRFPSANKLTVS